MTSRLALAATLVFALAACGSPADDSDTPTGAEATGAVTTTPGADVTSTRGGGEPPAVATSSSPNPTPVSSTTAAPKSAPVVAAATPPEAFKQCAACHSTEPGKTLLGPSLAGIFGTKAGDVPGFKFSPAMIDSGLTWNAATLDTYLSDPKKLVPGTTMSFNGVKDDAKRAAIIAYLKTL